MEANWQETVMSETEIMVTRINPSCYLRKEDEFGHPLASVEELAIATRQAEITAKISFEAGQKDEAERGCDREARMYDGGYGGGKQEGETHIKQLQDALEADATDLWKVTNAIKKEIASRDWILEGRGSYSWDDERYKQETRLAFESVLKLITEVQHPAQLRFHKVMDKSQSYLKEAKQDGRREVMEFVKDFKTMLFSDFNKKYNIPRKEQVVSGSVDGLMRVMQAKLKEWRVEK